MQNKRLHERLKLDLVEVHGKMSLAEKVEILDISLGGVSLKADRRLNLGKEILLKLEEQGRSIDLRSVVVRSELSGIETNATGDQVSVYTAGLSFKDGQTDQIISFFNCLMQDIQQAAPAGADRRLNVRFQSDSQEEKVLALPAQFRVKVVSPRGMSIVTDHALPVESMAPMSLSLDAGKTIDFVGRVASCSTIEEEGQTKYEIGVEFKDLSDTDKTSIRVFIDSMAELEARSEGE